ncbi:substrate-binding periplasmic protein [Spartinivicinus poritis]|uniref:Transporter substrate-binding domain-containing protein n=1 Tax=Spartinivicinus poritis TaxID=2994640 RepID=A0ABT5UD23_9GAMM|nr:transporter substrate-binding domain-containing protein [Spartinivicinus sp. A2-2]MDE1464271.1 transporter substrate-binding domain-containing protein [Spartinivicinus sp. A2-2]
MIRWLYIIQIVVLMVAAPLVISCPLQKLTYITEDYPPHNFVENGELQGVAVDLLIEALKAIKCPIDKRRITVLPWTRGYNMALNKPGIVLFGMSRLNEREHLFKWAGPYIKARVSLIAKKSSKIKIHNINELNNFTIGVVKDDAGERQVKSVGVKPVNLKYGNNHPETLAKMLVLDRFDLWAYEINVANWMFTKSGYNTDDFEVVYSFQSIPAFYAFNKNTPDFIVKMLQDGIDKVSSSKTKSGHTFMDKVYEKYGLK